MEVPPDPRLQRARLRAPLSRKPLDGGNREKAEFEEAGGEHGGQDQRRSR